MLTEVWPASLFKKHTIQKILIQTDSEIHFDESCITKKENACDKTNYIQGSRFASITPASFEVLQAIR